MAGKTDLIFEQGKQSDDVIVKTVDGEQIGHYFPRDGHPGSYTLMTKDHGGWWTDKPAQHLPSLVEAKGQARVHGYNYFQQEERNLAESGRNHLINSLEEQWNKMGGNPKIMKEFKAEWERVVAVEYQLKVVEHQDGHER